MFHLIFSAVKFALPLLAAHQMAAHQTENLIGKKDLAKFLGVSEATVTRMVIAGTGPRYHRVGLFVKFKMSDVHAWLDRRAVDTREKVTA